MKVYTLYLTMPSEALSILTLCSPGLSVDDTYNEVRQLQNQADKSGDQEAWKRHNRTANQLKARKDSLQNRFDEACAKIKYIHKKQKEI